MRIRTLTTILTILALVTVAVANQSKALVTIHPQPTKEKWTGVGFFVSERKVLTAGHVALAAYEMAYEQLQLSGDVVTLLPKPIYVRAVATGSMVSARVLFIDTIYDIAILETTQRIAGTRTLEVSFALPSAGDNLTVLTVIEMSFAIKVPLKCLHPRVIVDWGSTEDRQQPIPAIVSAWHLQGGCSGSPVLHRGKVVAIHVGSSRAFALATPLTNLSRWGKYFLLRW